MVGLFRNDLTPKYSYYALGWLTRMLQGRRWIRNDAFGPEAFACVFEGEQGKDDLIIGWSPNPYAYVRVNNDERGLTFYDIYGTKRHVPLDKRRTGSLPVPLGESPIYVVGAKGLKATVRPNPGW